MHYNILDEKRKNIMPLLRNFKGRFYIAGGTALAFHLGHRDSIDFDFFSSNDFDRIELFKEITEIFSGHEILKVQDEKNTLTVIIDNDIKLSFFGYKYKLIKPLFEEENIDIASIEDIACMKLAAITSRATNKDYLDLYFILKKFSLADILYFTEEKFPAIDRNLILKSLVYFEDIENEPMVFKEGNEISFNEIKESLKASVKEFTENKS